MLLCDEAELDAKVESEDESNLIDGVNLSRSNNHRTGARESVLLDSWICKR